MAPSAAAELADAQAVLSNGLLRRGPTPAQVRAGANGPLFSLRPLILQRFDKNSDGALDESELADLHQLLFSDDHPSPTSLDALRQNILKQFDKNGDGKLDFAESAAAKAFLQQMLADLDKNSSNTAAPANSTAIVIPRPATRPPKVPGSVATPSTAAPKQN